MTTFFIEALVFILVLLLFALFASWIGKFNGNRKEHSMTANKIDTLRNRPTQVAGTTEGICTLPAMRQEG